MKYALAIFFVLISGVVAAATSQQTLSKGGTSTINVDYEIGDVVMAEPVICEYLVNQNRRSIYLNARDVGQTKITIWDAGGAKRDEIAIRVVGANLKEIVDKTRAEIGDYVGVKIEAKNGRVEVLGEVAEPDEFQKIESLARQNPKVKSRVRLARDAIDTVAQAIREAIGVPGVTVRSVRDKIVLEGMAYSGADAKRAVEIARLYSPDVMDLIDVRDTKRQVGRGKMIELSFHMMEIKKSALQNMGVNWAPGAIPQGDSGNAGSGLFSSIAGIGKELLGFVFQLVPKLRMVRERGDGRVLENPAIIVKSGEEAKIFSGSEIPYYKGNEVEFKKVGIEIEAVPIEIDGGVDIKLRTTLSTPAAEMRGAINTNTISTSAICRFGQSLVLGNMVRSGDIKIKNRIPPGIDTASALFTLFLSKDFQSSRSEFVVFVTPRLVEVPASAEAELMEYLSLEESVMRDRSKKEFNAYMSGKKEAAPVPENKKGTKRRKWR